MFSLRKLGAFARTYRHLQRYNRMLQVAFKYGFTDILGRLHIDQYLEVGWRRDKGLSTMEGLTRLSRPERVRLAFEELGPTFIKLGQVLSSRPDIFPREYTLELARLQDHIPPVSWQEVEGVLQSEFGLPVEDLFLEFSHEAMAAASIGQVHLARLKNGQAVVVKVQRPDIAQTVQIDLEIFAHLASLMEQYLEEMHGHAPTAVVDEFAASINRELDFSLELASMQRFAAIFAGNPDIHVPVVYPELCTSRVVVMERIEGIKASDAKRLRAEGYDLPLAARRVAQLFMEQVFLHGFFHGDPHPGNIFLLPGCVPCFIDFGQMGRLSRRDKETFIALMSSLIKKDESEMANGVLRATIQFGEVDREGLERDLLLFADRYLYQSLDKMSAAPLFQDLFKLAARYRLSFKPNLYLMMKALATLEGLVLILDPKIELFTLARPFIQRLQFERLRPRRVLEDAMGIGLNYVRLFRSLPATLHNLLALLQGGRMKIGFEHQGLDSLQRTVERASNRIAFAIVLAALIVGSSLIVVSGVPPRWYGVPVIGLLGYVLAACIGFGLLLSVLRHHNM